MGTKALTYSRHPHGRESGGRWDGDKARVWTRAERGESRRGGQWLRVTRILVQWTCTPRIMGSQFQQDTSHCSISPLCRPCAVPEIEDRSPPASRWRVGETCLCSFCMTDGYQTLEVMGREHPLVSGNRAWIYKDASHGRAETWGVLMMSTLLKSPSRLPQTPGYHEEVSQPLIGGQASSNSALL